MEETNKKIEKGIEKEYVEKPSLTEEGGKEALEKIELSREETEEKQELEKEIEKIKLSPDEKVQAQKQADELKRQTAQGKIQHLLDLAQSQGIAYAIEVARKINDPYLLDLFHDTLAKQGLFKKFLEK